MIAAPPGAETAAALRDGAWRLIEPADRVRYGGDDLPEGPCGLVGRPLERKRSLRTKQITRQAH